MTRSAIILFSIALLVASSALASARVDNVELSYQNGQTVARIVAGGNVQFSHQTEIAKDGRPYRVIVDVMAATHHLGQKEFDQLPACLVTGIRTSQYSVKPEQVVRVVFDMAKPTAYQIKAYPQGVEVRWQDKSAQPFAVWNSSRVVTESASESKSGKGFVSPKPSENSVGVQPQAKIAALNKAIQSDAVSSLDEPKAQPAPTKKPAVARSAPAKSAPQRKVKQTKSEQPRVQVPLPQATPTLAHQESSVDERPAQQERPQSTPQFSDKAWYAAAPQPVKKSQPEPKAEQPKIAKANKPAVSKPLVAVTTPVRPAPAKSVEKVAATPTPARPTPLLTPTAPETAQVEKKETKAKQERSTARFRRDPSVTKKMKGTMVAEFPSRLVIKYKSPTRRDPFSTLINEAHSRGGALEDRIPNVDGLRLVGIIESESGRNSALFQDTEGYSYILEAGDKVRRGYVLRVESDRVYFQIFEYGWSRTLALNLEE